MSSLDLSIYPLPDLDFSFMQQMQAGSIHFYTSSPATTCGRMFQPSHTPLFTALASRKKAPVINSSWLWRIGIIATLLKQESYISIKFGMFPIRNYSAADSYDKNWHDDKTRFPKGCSQQGRPCVKTQPVKAQSGVGKSGQKSNVETGRMEGRE